MTEVFDRQAATYDAWYDTPKGAAVFAEERDALQPLLAGLPHPWLEVGIGTGRFAASLGVEYGIDPAPLALSFAARRSCHVAVAVGEALPFPSATFGAVLIVTTLCFVAEPLAVLREARRVIRPEGGVGLGIVPREGAWGQRYQSLAAQGRPYYRHAHFFGRSELTSLLDEAGLQPIRWRSALFWPPESEPDASRRAVEGDQPAAGFLAVLTKSRNK